MRKFLLLTVTACFFALGCTDPKTEVPRLMTELRSSDARTRSRAALALGRIGAPHASPATPQLILLLRDPNVGVQSAAAAALRGIGSPEAQAALDRASRR